MRQYELVLCHVKAAADRAASSLAVLRAQWRQAQERRDPALGMQLEELDRALDGRCRRMSELHRLMTVSRAGQLPGLWKEFFECYDEFLELGRSVRADDVNATRCSRPDAGAHPPG